MPRQLSRCHRSSGVPLRGVSILLVFVLICSSHSGFSFAEDKHATESSKSATTFIVVRHAERDGNLDLLSVPGIERANLLGELGKFLNVSAIHSTNTERTKNTVKPLAAELNLEVQLYGKADQAWADQLQQQHPGDVLLIVGHSNTTGVIAGLLACKEPFPIGHDEYDAMFIVTVGESGTNCVRLKYGPTSIGSPSADADKMGTNSGK